MKTAWLPIAILLACTSDEPVVDSTTDAASSSTDAPTTDAPTTDTPTTDIPTTGDPSTSSGDVETTDVETTDVDPDSSTDDGASSSGDDTTTGPIPEACEGIEMIELTAPFVTPTDSKSWTPGGSVNVGATMHNPGPDYTNYPSIIVESDNPLVTSGMPNNSLFAILTDMSVEIFVVFAADDAVAPGTEVTFTIDMASLDLQCANGDSIEVTATVE